ncbi:MAG: hypothetical protein RLZZ298_1868 [Pseudomonadota bacterium]|jgi:hypothetical protein
MTDIIAPGDASAPRILFIRNSRVMLDADLAVLYGVPTKVFNQAVKRNLNRFPADFMFQLNDEEFTNLRSQFVTSRTKRGQTPLVLFWLCAFCVPARFISPNPRQGFE